MRALVCTALGGAGFFLHKVSEALGRSEPLLSPLREQPTPDAQYAGCHMGAVEDSVLVAARVAVVARIAAWCHVASDRAAPAADGRASGAALVTSALGCWVHCPAPSVVCPLRGAAQANMADVLRLFPCAPVAALPLRSALALPGGATTRRWPLLTLACASGRRPQGLARSAPPLAN